MKKFSNDKLSNEQLIIFSIVFAILGIVLLFFKDSTQIIPTYYVSFAFWIVSIISFLVLVTRIKRERDISLFEDNIKEDTEKATALSDEKTTLNTLKDVRINKKLITCKTCGAKIARTAEHCPHCGARTPGEAVNQVVKGIGYGIIFAVIFIPCFIGLIYAIVVLNAFK